MANWTEKLGDFVFELASRYTSIRNGRPTQVVKEIITGPRIDGVVRPDVPDEPGAAIWLALNSGRTVTIQEYHAREIRRRIVFLDSPKT